MASSLTREQAVPASTRSLFDKIWDAHEVAEGLLYIDLHLVHEVTSPQAFESLRLAGRPVRRPDRTLATADHNVPTDGSTAAQQIRDQLSRVQVETLERNAEEQVEADRRADHFREVGGTDGELGKHPEAERDGRGVGVAAGLCQVAVGSHGEPRAQGLQDDRHEAGDERADVEYTSSLP